MPRLHIIPKVLQILIEEAIAGSDAGVQVVPANAHDPAADDSTPAVWCRVDASVPHVDGNMYVKSSGATVLAPCMVEIMLVVAGPQLRSNAHAAYDYAYAIAQVFGDNKLRDTPFTHQVEVDRFGYKRFISGTGPGEGADRLMHIMEMKASGIVQRVA